jgi:hypothetical protein
MAKYQLGIIYILREGFQIYAPGMPSILEFRFVPEIVRDLDVANKELLYNLLKIFISGNNIPKSSLIIVIGDSASIIKDFIITPVPVEEQAAQLEQLHKLADEFLEHIPFEEVSSKSFPIDNGIRAYGTNKELYESIKEAFLQEAFEVLMVLPAIAIGPEINTKAALDTDAINSILKKEPLLKEFNLLKQSLLTLQPEEASTESTEPTKQEKKSGNKKTILIIGVFVVLIIVLILVYINQPQ